MFDGNQLTVTGYTHAEKLRTWVIKADSWTGHHQTFFRILSNRQVTFKLCGNLCPDAGVAKITGKEGETFSGVAKVYDSELR